MTTRAPWSLWSEKDDATLRKLAHQGLSASQVATKMSVTRNAVIGRYYRADIVLARSERWMPCTRS